ncbi:MAG: hypothetical protein ACE5FT_03145 [Candidatus Nanoarchaeia archaeon]
MANLTEEQLKHISEKYGSRFGVQVEEEHKIQPEIVSRQYKQFKTEMLPPMHGWYEKVCNFSGRILKLKLAPKRKAELTEFIDICHFDITPEGVDAAAVLLPMIFMFTGAGIAGLLFQSMFFAFFFLMAGAIMMIPMRSYVQLQANAWRMKASNQMVLCVFYIVTYMRHTSNLEGAINFASNHLSPPLNLDMKKVVWDVESAKFESVRDSLDSYLDTWRKYNNEFVEAMHLIESSLYEGNEERRGAILDKSLDVILTETYEKMLHYAHNLKSPITILHMMGVIMPILGLVILPIVVSFLGGVKWYHISTLYNVILPIAVYYVGSTVLATRPTGYGDADIGEKAEFKKYRNLVFNLGGREFQFPPAIVAGGVMFMFLAVALAPPTIGALMNDDTKLAEAPFIERIGTTDLNFKFLEYRRSNNPAIQGLVGPYGVGASLLSLAYPLALGLGIGMYFLLRSRKLVKIRDQTKKLENEFASALFQLGSRLGDGMPAELAFGRVATAIEGTVSGKFFEQVSTNVRKLGMGLHEAIFNHKTGAILSYPSQVIASSMKVFIESIKKGPRVASEALLNISRYIKEIHRVDERLKDLMADIIASMNSQINFMAPAISGIVVGITSMITTILGGLQEKAAESIEAGAAGGGLDLFKDLFSDAIPTYYFQLVVGVYVVQIIYILTILSAGIENGSDKLNEEFQIGKNLIRSVIIYCTIAFIVTILFNAIAAAVMAKT